MILSNIFFVKRFGDFGEMRCQCLRNVMLPRQQNIYIHFFQCGYFVTESFDFLGMFANLEHNQPKQSKKDLVTFHCI